MLNKILNQFVFQIGNYLLPLLIIPFLIDRLSLEVYANIIALQSIVMILVVLINYGLDLSGVRYVALNLKSLSKPKYYVIASIFYRVIVALISVLILFIYSFFFMKVNTLIIVSAIFWLSTFIIQINWYFQAIGEFKLITIYGLIPKLLLYPLVFYFIKSDVDAWIFLIICGVANLISNTLMLTFFIRKTKSTVFNFKSIVFKVKYIYFKNKNIAFSQASVTLVTYSNFIILPFIIDARAFVIYSTADRIVKILSMFTTPILNVFFPIFSTLVIRNKVEAFRIIRKTIILFSMVFLVGYLFFYFFGFYVVNIVFPKVSDGLYFSLMLILFNIWLVFVNNLLGTQIGLNLRKDREFFKVVLICGIVSVIAMTSSGFLFSLTGVLVSSLIVQFMILAGMYNIAKSCGFTINERN